MAPQLRLVCGCAAFKDARARRSPGEVLPACGLHALGGGRDFCAGASFPARFVGVAEPKMAATSCLSAASAPGRETRSCRKRSHARMAATMRSAAAASPPLAANCFWRAPCTPAAVGARCADVCCACLRCDGASVAKACKLLRSGMGGAAGRGAAQLTSEGRTGAWERLLYAP